MSGVEGDSTTLTNALVRREMVRNMVIGLDIGTSAVRAAEVDVKKNPPVLARFGQITLPSGAVRDGEIIDEQVVSDTLTELWGNARFKSKRVIVGVANQRIIVRQVEMPWMEASDLEAGLAFQVQDHLPIPVEDAILDFQILEEFPGEENERMMRVLLVAAQREMINSLVRTLKMAGLRPKTIDLVPFALIRTLALEHRLQPEVVDGADIDGLDELEKDPGTAEAIVDIGAGITNIVVHEQGLPRFVRILVAGGDDITEALSTVMGSSYEEAEDLKCHLTPERTSEEAMRVVEERLQTMVEEVRGSLEYYRAQTKSARLARVVLTGGGAQMPHLLDRMEASTGVRAEMGHPLSTVRLGKLGMAHDQIVAAESLISVPVGLALGDAL